MDQLQQSNQPSSDEKPDKEEALDLLMNDDDEKKPEERKEATVKDKEEEPKREEKEEEEEPEIKLAEEEQVEDQLDIPVSRKDILKKYPTLFKDFPFLESQHFKLREYTELFGTVDDARETIEKAEQFGRLQQEVYSGDLTTILKSVKEDEPENYAKIIDNYIPTLMKVDPEAYTGILTNIFRRAVLTMHQEGKRMENEKLQEAALILNQFMFNNSDVPPEFSLSKSENRESAKEKELKEREQEFLRQRYETTYQDLAGRIDNVLKATIEKNIDPRESMSGYVKKNAIRDALTMVQDNLKQDPAFKKVLDGLWKKAFEANFDRTSVDNIRKAYLGKAKTVLPEMIKKARSEALKDTPAKREREKEREDNSPINRGRSTSSSSKGGKTEIPKGMSSLEFLMQD